MHDLYQQVILAHNRDPHHYGELEDPAVRVRAYNPVCGDEVTLMLAFSGGNVENVRFTARGCALCRASASMMTDMIIDRPVSGLERLQQEVRSAFQDEEAGRLAELGELQAFRAVRDHPARIKCVLLPWHALEDALASWREGGEKPEG